MGKEPAGPQGKGSPEDRAGWQEFFLGHLLPKVQDKESFLASQVSDCTSSLFGTERALGPGRRSHMSLGVYSWSGIWDHSYGAEGFQIWGLWGWEGIYIDCHIPPAWGLEIRHVDSGRPRLQPLRLSKPPFSTP